LPFLKVGLNTWGNKVPALACTRTHTHTHTHSHTRTQGVKAPAHTLAEVVRLLSSQEATLSGRKQKSRSSSIKAHRGGEDAVIKDSSADVLKDELSCLREAIAVLKKGEWGR